MRTGDCKNKNIYIYINKKKADYLKGTGEFKTSKNESHKIYKVNRIYHL